MYGEYTSIDMVPITHNTVKGLNDLIEWNESDVKVCGVVGEGFFQKPFSCIMRGQLYVARVLDNKENELRYTDSFPELLKPVAKFMKQEKTFIVYPYALIGDYWLSKIKDNLVEDIKRLHQDGFIHGDIHIGNLSPTGNLLDPGLIGKVGEPIRILNKALYNVEHKIYTFDMDYHCFKVLTDNSVKFSLMMSEVTRRFNEKKSQDTIALQEMEGIKKNNITRNFFKFIIYAVAFFIFGSQPVSLILMTNRTESQNRWVSVILSPVLIFPINATCLRWSWEKTFVFFAHVWYLTSVGCVIALLVLVYESRGANNNFMSALIMNTASFFVYSFIMIRAWIRT